MKLTNKLGMFFTVIVSYSAFNSYAATPVTPLYACDTCGYDQAVIVAKQHAPEPECRLSTPSGEAADIEDLVCVAKSQNIIVSNARTKQSFKFKVTHNVDPYQNSIITATKQTITNTEQFLINQFFQLDTDFRNAINKIQSENVMTMSTTSSDDCENHPTQYFRDGVFGERATQTEFSKKIADAMGNSTWADFTDVTNFTGGNLQISKDGIGIGISLEHNANKYYVTKVYGGNPYNKLVFEVQYLGDANLSNGSRNLNLQLTLEWGASLIDGIPLSSLFRDGTVDLTGGLISNCLREYIMDKGVLEGTSSGGSGGSDGSGGSGGAYMGGSGDICFYTTNACATSQGITTCRTQRMAIVC